MQWYGRGGSEFRGLPGRTGRGYHAVMDPQGLLANLVSGGSLSAEQAEGAFEELLTGRMDAAQIGAMLALVQTRGPTVDELVGAARAMRRHVTRVPFPCGVGSPGHGDPVIDTCGTGGAAKTFNVSTAAAIVAAAVPADAAGRRVRVAKHGNRSRSGRGSAEVLAALGVNVDASPEVQALCLERVGVCFCFAVHHHPAMKHAAPARKSLGFPTIFNLLGPLTNPAGATRQLMGVYAPGLVARVAHALARLGADRAMVVHSMDGLDDLSVTGPSLVAHVEGGRVEMEEFDPRALGVPRARLVDLIADDLEDAARMVRAVLEGEEGARREMVALNAAAALVVAGRASDLGEGLALARGAIDSGGARRTLEALVRVSGEGG